MQLTRANADLIEMLAAYLNQDHPKQNSPEERFIHALAMVGLMHGFALTKQVIIDLSSMNRLTVDDGSSIIFPVAFLWRRR
jgi:hypothetical protein